jgi:hypothetical protein
VLTGCDPAKEEWQYLKPSISLGKLSRVELDLNNTADDCIETPFDQGIPGFLMTKTVVHMKSPGH